ncbi:GNAT family N-acetyltransferase [Bifidobacterium actinocoloniiforme]|nr:GNAT family N-acetyltransferase [Bifidobacterium actinocoloniiforme]
MLDYKLFERQLLAEQLMDERKQDDDSIIVAVADSAEELQRIVPPQSSPEPAGSANPPRTKPNPSRVQGQSSRIIGFINLSVRPDPTSGRPCGYISQLCVDQRFQGEGIGKSLLTEAKQWANRNGLFKLTVNLSAANESAISFCEKLGLRLSAVSMEVSCAQPDC